MKLLIIETRGIGRYLAYCHAGHARQRFYES